MAYFMLCKVLFLSRETSIKIEYLQFLRLKYSSIHLFRALSTEIFVQIILSMCTMLYPSIINQSKFNSLSWSILRFLSFSGPLPRGFQGVSLAIFGPPPSRLDPRAHNQFWVCGPGSCKGKKHWNHRSANWPPSWCTYKYDRILCKFQQIFVILDIQKNHQLNFSSHFNWGFCWSPPSLWSVAPYLWRYLGIPKHQAACYNTWDPPTGSL